MKLKPYLMKYQCPHCKMGLQSEHTESGKSLSCPGCKQAFIAPPAPPRPIGGWLTFYGVILILALCFYVLPFAIFPETLLLAAFIFMPGVILVYGFFKQRRWFIPCVLFAQVFNIQSSFLNFAPEGVNEAPEIVWIRLGIRWAIAISFLLYFWRSQRVKETFTT